MNSKIGLVWGLMRRVSSTSTCATPSSPSSSKSFLYGFFLDFKSVSVSFSLFRRHRDSRFIKGRGEIVILEWDGLCGGRWRRMEGRAAACSEPLSPDCLWAKPANGRARLGGRNFLFVFHPPSQTAAKQTAKSTPWYKQEVTLSQHSPVNQCHWDCLWTLQWSRPRSSSSSPFILLIAVSSANSGWKELGRTGVEEEGGMSRGRKSISAKKLREINQLS